MSSYYEAAVSNRIRALEEKRKWLLERRARRFLSFSLTAMGLMILMVMTRLWWDGVI